MMLDYNESGKLKVDMKHCVKNITKEYPEKKIKLKYYGTRAYLRLMLRVSF